MQKCIWGFDYTNNQPVKIAIDANGVVQAKDPLPAERESNHGRTGRDMGLGPDKSKMGQDSG
jgi:hypothetical protein